MFVCLFTKYSLSFTSPKNNTHKGAQKQMKLLLLFCCTRKHHLYWTAQNKCAVELKTTKPQPKGPESLWDNQTCPTTTWEKSTMPNVDMGKSNVPTCQMLTWEMCQMLTSLCEHQTGQHKHPCGKLQHNITAVFFSGSLRWFVEPWLSEDSGGHSTSTMRL